MIANILYGYKGTQCLYVAAKLNIADHLSSGYKSITELSVLTNTNPDALYRIMRCLASLGVFDESKDKEFGLNDEAKDLLSDSESTIKDFVILCGEELYQAAGDLLYSAYTGKPSFDNLYGIPHWQYLEENPDKAKIFHDAMEKGTLPMIREIIKNYDFSDYKSIVDIGGGKGHLLCEILSQYKNANGIVLDLPNAGISAHEYILSKSLSDRAKFISGDFFKSTPTADMYLLKVVLHDWDDEHSIMILQNCRQSISNNGKLLIIDKVIRRDHLNPITTYLGDINMLVTVNGKERTESQFSELLNSSGFKLSRVIHSSTVFSIIEAEPAQ